MSLSGISGFSVNRWLLQISQLLGRSLQRTYKEPRKIRMVETGWGLNIVPPPEPREGGVRLAPSPHLESAP